jgi:hypothetical protein
MPDIYRAHDLYGLITKVALRAYACPYCGATKYEKCFALSGPLGHRMKAVKMHAGRWNKAERLLREHTHPGLLVRRPS